MPQFHIPRGLAIRLDHHFHGLDPEPGSGDGKLDSILSLVQTQQQTLNILVQQGGHLMASVTQLQAELQGINVATNRIAVSNSATAATLVELGSDLTDLLARVPDLPQALLDEATAIRTGLEQAAANIEAQAVTLTGLAAQHTPAAEPPPIDPPPVEDPPPVDPVSGRRR